VPRRSGGEDGWWQRRQRRPAAKGFSSTPQAHRKVGPGRFKRRTQCRAPTGIRRRATSLHATTTELQWITDGYTLSFAALLTVAGALGDRYGRRGALLAGLAVFGAGSAGAALSHDATELIAFRAVMGIGGAFVMPATLSILTDVFPPQERAKAIAAWSSIAGVGIVVGPAIGGLLLDSFSWHSVFWVNVPLVIVALVAVTAIVPRLPLHRSRDSRLDLPGAVLSALAMLVAIDAVIEGPNHGWLSAPTVGELAVAAGLSAAFVIRELRSASPLIDVRVFRHRAFSAATASVGLTFFALFGSLFALTQYLQLVHGYSPLSAGLRAMPFAVAVMIASPLSSSLVVRFGTRVVIQPDCC
jgi:EmrB/QacA subfamily drug resistance transporter